MIAFSAFVMPKGWRWLEWEGQQIWRPYDASGALRSYRCAYAYNPADLDVMAPDSDIQDSIQRGSAIQVNIAEDDVPRDGRVLMQALNEKMGAP